MPAKTNGSPGRGSAKAALRNFTFTKEADAELVRLKTATGKNMTAVLEDLLLSAASSPRRSKPFWKPRPRARAGHAPRSSNGRSWDAA